MTKGRVTHATITVERTYDVSPARAFAAWGGPDAHRLWHTPGEGWMVAASERSFVTGGRDFCRFGPPSEPVYHSDGRFLFIEANIRVVSAGTMYCRDVPTSSTLCTVEFIPDRSGGTKLIVTDQSAYFDGLHDPAERGRGWQAILANFAQVLA